MKRACTITSFKDLEVIKKNLRNKKNIPKHKTDEELFLEAMSNVREIKEFREIPVKSPHGIKARSMRAKDDFEMLRQVVTGERKIRLSDTGEYMEWTSPEIRKDVSEKLHRGDFSVQDCIDLHGMTLIEAEEALKQFFGEAVKNRLFCIKVIHGRGLRSPNGPVLKGALKKWLHGHFRKRVLAYATAKDCDGGLGATYIILK